MDDNPSDLSLLQRDILELEATDWVLPGEKIAEFRRRHPRVTETAFYVALNRLLTDRRAYEYDSGRYAPMLNRMAAAGAAAAGQREHQRSGSAPS